MKKIENDCVGCPTYCTDCGAKRTPHYYCDRCGNEDILYFFGNEELCMECIVESLEVVEGSE